MWKNRNGQNLGDMLADALREADEMLDRRNAKPVRSSHYVTTLRAEASRPDIAQIKAIRDTFIEYTENPKAYIDFDSMEPAYDNWGDKIHGKFTFRVKTMEDAAGLKFLGNGCFSNVYEINERFVLKIVKTQDTGYARFVEMIKDHSDNPHFPKVLYSGVWAGRTVYVLEKLTAYPDGDDSNYDLNEYFRDAMHASLNDGEGNPFIKTSFVNPMVEQAAHLLQKHSMLGDLHGGNVMFRGNVPVITDPCTS